MRQRTVLLAVLAAFAPAGCWDTNPSYRAPQDLAVGDMQSPRSRIEVHVTGGSFTMGTNADPANFNGHDTPSFSSTVSNFYMDQSEVTLGEYLWCVAAGSCMAAGSNNVYCNYTHLDRIAQPINCVDYTQAVAFCTWIGRRLPSEDEWEYAARGSAERMYTWGDTAPAKQLCWSRGLSGTCAEGSITGNSVLGFNDLAGNVWEWTSTPACDYPDRTNICQSSAHVVRGASWSDTDPHIVAATVRLYNPDSTIINNTGFRCARTP